MDRFEYKTEFVKAKGWWTGKFNNTELQEQLNQNGMQGWELVNAVTVFDTNDHVVFIFKRKMYDLNTPVDMRNGRGN
jgi:hypothetical protein